MKKEKCSIISTICNRKLVSEHAHLEVAGKACCCLGYQCLQMAFHANQLGDVPGLFLREESKQKYNRHITLQKAFPKSRAAVNSPIKKDCKKSHSLSFSLS